MNSASSDKVDGGGSPSFKKKNIALSAYDDKPRDFSADLPFYILNPSGKKKSFWDLYAMIILLYAVCCAPLRLAFDIEDYCPSGIWIIETLIDLSFVLDFFLNFFTAVYVIEASGCAKLSSHLVVIARDYLKSWFMVDFVSSVPIDVLSSLYVNGCVGRAAQSTLGLGSIGDTARLVRILRLVKLLKILRILRLQSRFADLSDRLPLLNAPVLKLFQPLFCTMYFAHILACGFYAVGAGVFYSAPPGAPIQMQSWLASSKLEMPPASCKPNSDLLDLDFDDMEVASMSREAKLEILDQWHAECGRPTLPWSTAGNVYVASLYWTFTTITTVGYGDLTPQATSERAYAIFSMCIGTGIFAYIISAMTNTLADYFKGDAQVQMKFRALRGPRHPLPSLS